MTQQPDLPRKKTTDDETRPAGQENEQQAVADHDREESVPSDGRDVEGEELMKQVRNDQLKEPPPAA